MRSANRRISSALVLILSATVLLVMSVSQVPQASAQTHPYYEMGIGILDFRESDHTANMSIHFRADFEMKEGKPGLYGLDLENRWTRMMGDYVHQEKNGTLVDDGIGSWVFDFSIRAHAFGASEFYPYDSWMFNLTLSTPLLHEANSTNFSGFVNPRGLPGWNIEGAETFRLTHFNYDDSATVTVVLRRAGWQIAPMLVIPPILLLMLGMTLLIPPKDLSTKATVYTSVIFFVAALLFNLRDVVSPSRFGSTFAEDSFFYLFLVASLYLMFAVVENVCSMEDGMLYQRSAKIRLGLQLVIRLATLVLVWYFLWTTVSSYQAMASFYSWVSFPLPDAFYLPGSFASAGIVISSVILAYNSKKRTNGAFRPMQEPDNPKELGAPAKGKRAEPEPVRPDNVVDRALQMFTYYGQISWQGLAFFGAAGLVVALVPLGICQKPSWILIADELFAVAFMGLGAVFFDRYQNVAHRWIHVGTDTAVEDLIDNTEWGRPYREPGHEPPRPPCSTRRLQIVIGIVILGYLVFVCTVLYTTPCIAPRIPL